MKPLFLLSLVLSTVCYGQQQEFKIYDNGLIYDAPTMKSLGLIVDSLNLKFKACELSHPYHAYVQGYATEVKVPGKNARKLIKSGISLAEYKRRHPFSVKDNKVYVIKYRYEDYENKKFIDYAELSGGSETSVSVSDVPRNDKTDGWVLDDEDNVALYLDNLQSPELPSPYARLVQYVDCMIDTTASIYFPSAEGARYKPLEGGSKAEEFLTWADSFGKRPTKIDYETIEKLNLNSDSVWDVYYVQHNAWDSARMVFLDSKVPNSDYWKSVLMEAVNEGVEKGNSNEQLEFFVARYLSNADALRLMRSRKVVGNCSQDQRPRYHAMNICRLAAETSQWDIFLRSHLDIMNDRFERMSDGSYAWAKRKTYLKELEELDINAVDLLLGTCLRVEDVSSNHYWGSISRIGRALADAKETAAMEKEILTMMCDNKLDLYNRLQMSYLYSHYVYNIDDDAEKGLKAAVLKEAIEKMPKEIKEIWKKG